MTVTIDISNLLSWLGPAVLLVIMVAGVVWLLMKLRRLLAHRNFAWDDRHVMHQRWLEVEQLAQQPGEVGRRMAIVEADKLLDHALKNLMMPGETLGERLKFAQYKYPELKKVWWAHKVRNQLVHEATAHLDPGVGHRALREFRRALERLGAI